MSILKTKRSFATKWPSNCLSNEAGLSCTHQGNCEGCGFDKAEAERRKTLPLIKGEDGLRRRHVEARIIAD